MRIWIDLANSPHVPFFRPLADEFIRRQHEVIVTARDFAETVALAEAAQFSAEVVGGHGGRKLTGKAGNLIQRGLLLARWARGRNIDLAVSHNSYSQILGARALSLPSVTMMDYEHQPANHFAFRFASRVIVPRSFPQEALRRFGADTSKVRRYNGTKEDVYLADFQPDPLSFQSTLADLGINKEDILITMRPPASEALYHRFENQLFDELLHDLSGRPSIKIVLLPRSETQRKNYGLHRGPNIIIPTVPIDGPNLIAHSDLVISAGGTMNREAAALGTPAFSIYAGEWAAIDEELVREGRLTRIDTREAGLSIPIRKKGTRTPRRAVYVLKEVADLILEP
jgi:predicted glycosyltransferase